jgi:hypothetical protein
MLEYKMFNRLPSWSQVEVLTQTGTVVAQRHHNGWAITLYSLNNYFVERWARQELEIVCSFQRAANPLDIMEPYMQDIQWQDLYER